jgi:tetratricopeptide (TPR) repeat protein
MRKAFVYIILVFAAVGFSVFPVCAQAKTPAANPARTITVVTEPNAAVWLNDIRFGTTGADGKLAIKIVSAGAKKLRVRAMGFKEITQNLLPAQKGEVKITLVKTTDEAELAFQQGEALTSTDREKAIEKYKEALKLRPKYVEAYLGLARVLADNGDGEGALAAVKNAKKLRPLLPEATAIEGRIHKSGGDEALAIAAFKRSIAEGKGFQPEAHTGLGMIYREKAEGFGSTGDFESEKENYLLAVAELKKAVAQLAGAPDAIVVYQLLGDSYERAKMLTEAIKVYEEFLRVFPDADEASIVRSFITQIQKQMAEQK